MESHQFSDYLENLISSIDNIRSVIPLKITNALPHQLKIQLMSTIFKYFIEQL